MSETIYGDDVHLVRALDKIELAARQLKNPWHPEVTRCFEMFADEIAKISKEVRVTRRR